MAEIVIDKVAKSFGAFQALQDVHLVVRDQEFLVLLGASGSGKTTLLRLIAGLESGSSGTIAIGGKVVNALPPRLRGIAMVFQNYAVFPHLTVYENIAFGLRMKRVTGAAVDEKVRQSAEIMHIDSLLERYSGQLSGGQRQRVAVARALAVEPDVLLMDEPLSNLDALLRLEMRAELKEILQKSRTTTVYVTHDQVEAMSLGDRIAVMDGGRIVQVDSPIDVYRNPATRFVGGFIGNPPMNFLPAVRDGSSWTVAGTAFSGPDPTTVAPSRVRELEMGVRPEDLVPSTTGITGRVKVVEPLGPHLLVTMSVDDKMFRSVVDSDLDIKPGGTLTVAPKPDRIRWFDTDTMRAIGG